QPRLRAADALGVRFQPSDQEHPMRIHPKLICCFLPVVFLCGCKKSGSTQETPPTKRPPTTKPSASTNAVPATTAPAASAPAATGSAEAAASVETTAKMAAAEWALKQ